MAQSSQSVEPPRNQGRFSRWAIALAERRGYWRAVVAIAAKNARMAWAVLRRGDEFVLPA
jgi:transposase